MGEWRPRGLPIMQGPTKVIEKIKPLKASKSVPNHMLLQTIF